MVSHVLSSVYLTFVHTSPVLVCSLEDIGMHSVSFDRRVIMLGSTVYWMVENPVGFVYSTVSPLVRCMQFRMND